MCLCASCLCEFVSGAMFDWQNPVWGGGCFWPLLRRRGNKGCRMICTASQEGRNSMNERHFTRFTITNNCFTKIKAGIPQSSGHSRPFGAQVHWSISESVSAVHAMPYITSPQCHMKREKVRRKDLKCLVA